MAEPEKNVSAKSASLPGSSGILFASILGLGAIVVGGLDEIGWWAGIRRLTQIAPGLPTMKPLTSLCLILGGFCIVILSLGPLKAGTVRTKKSAGTLLMLLIPCAVVICIVLATLFEYRSGVSNGIDLLLFRAAVSAERTAFPGRMSVATAVAQLFLAISIVLITFEDIFRQAWHQLTGLVTITLGLAGVLGFAYGSGTGHAFAPFDTMAVHTAAVSFMLGLAILFVRPDAGVMADFNSPHLGGFLARRTLPVALTLPFFLGWLRLRGQRAGYYGTEFGLAIFACACTMLFGLLIWWTARELNRVDGQRIEARSFESRSSDILKEIAAGQPLPMILESVVTLVESRMPDSRCSILLLDSDGGRLLDGAGAQLPAEYREKIHGIAIGPEAGSCGTAAFYGKHVIVEDIATHPHWAKWKDIALKHGLKACWSFPILSAGGTVLGTFAVYKETTGAPRTEEIAWTDSATNLASIAIEKRNAEEALRTSEGQLRFLFENAGLGMAMATISGKLVKCNRALCAMLGYNESEFLKLDSTQVTFPEDLAADRQRFEALRAGKATSFQYIKRYIHKTGRMVYANLNISAVTDEAGQPAYVVGIIEDVTARHQADAENARVQAHAEQSQRLQALGTLAGGIAHDFNNILASIMGNVEFAMGAIGPNGGAKPHLDRIGEGVTRATDLVRQILAFSRLQAVERRALRIQPIIEEGLKLLRSTIPAKIEIQTALDAEVPAVLADATQIHQILMNLGTNAAQAMTPQGGILRVSLATAELTAKQITELAAGRYVRLTVSDTGSGMEQETLAHMFEPFFTTKPMGEGTGLGLSVVHGIVSSYGGAIHVTSKSGVGTRFDLYFPVAPMAATTEESNRSAVRKGSGERILVIDDEIAVAEIAQYQLENNGYQASVFTDPEAALEAFARDPSSFDCVLTDLSMPRRSGLEIAKAIRESRPEIPIVLASGFLSTEDQDAAAGLGISLFLMKPYRGAKLLETLAKAFSPATAELPPTR